MSSLILLGAIFTLFIHQDVLIGACECGWQSNSCENGTCLCPPQYELHSNGRDCHNKTCNTSEDCLECTSDLVCTRCVYFLEETTRQCLSTCNGEAKIVYTGPVQGSICILAKEEGLRSEVIIGIIAGVSAGLLLCILILIAYCVHIRRTRRNVNLNQTHYAAGNMQTGNVKKVPMYDNRGFDTENEPSLVNNVVDQEVFQQEVDRLLPHAQTLLTMLNEIRHKLRSMDKSDPRVPTYKGIIHQLCRVLVLIHRKEPGASIPSDALGLMEWAHQMLEDKQLDVEPAEESLETPPVNKISYVEVPSSQTNPYATPVIKKPNPYATLNKRNSQLNVTSASFYSSVPVPVDMNSESQANHVSVSQSNTLIRSNKASLKRQYEIPWDLKRANDSVTTLNCSGSDLTMGYFANGRFYDPTPRQPKVHKQAQPDIYAPASSYSDRSNPPVFSTFAGGIPRNQSFSSHPSGSNISEQNLEEEEVVDGDEEPFPFNMKDATEPVEV